jgi:hypothetical protein
LVNKLWIAADYHIPLTYSIRMAMTTGASASALPAPGPATVRLALSRVAIELYGLDQTRDILFPIFRSMEVRIKPPEEVAVSDQGLRLYKLTGGNKSKPFRITESFGSREYCHTEHTLTIYVKIPELYESVFRNLFSAIGYWGQASSLAFCTGVSRRVPRPGQCIEPFATFSTKRLKGYVTFPVTEFRDANVTWSEIQPATANGPVAAIVLRMYIWPLTLIEQRSTHKIYRHRSLVDIKEGT